jgi:hypothetical protein
MTEALRLVSEALELLKAEADENRYEIVLLESVQDSLHDRLRRIILDGLTPISFAYH